MTREEAIEYWEQFNSEIDDLYDACSDADRDVLAKQREAVKFTISALRAQQQPNAPLTLDELLEIDKASESVYFYIFRSDIDSGWQIIEQITDSKIIFRGRANIYVPIKGLGVSYNLYRQKPEEDKHENYT